MTMLDTLATLRRPRLLVRAARLGALDYRRTRDLPTALGANPARRQILPQLLAAEEQLEMSRRASDGTWSAERHISVLSALIAETRLVPRPKETAAA